jgi:hypothetical protein
MIDIGVAPFSTGDPHQRWLSFGPALTEIPKVVSWKPGVPRSSFVPPPQGASQSDAPSSSVDSTLPPAPSARSNPSPRLRSSNQGPFIGTHLLSEEQIVFTERRVIGPEDETQGVPEVVEQPEVQTDD